MTFEIIPTGHALGAEIRGVDLAGDLDDASIGSIRAAWREHLVLLFRGQTLEARALAALARRFGELDRVPGWDDAHPPGEPDLLVISNVERDGKPIGVLGSGEAEWHTD
ncbi:MAG: TauD/TfdA family dioxygenase, partial [Proteobacteria bacterium]|nr:TauD/TfdA family dioxygenase [Pseudomonadota bacterium]